MLATRPFIVVSGSPASGKTTLAKHLSSAFHLPLIDKDDILEDLFATFHEVDLALRQELSRVSDAKFIEQAKVSAGAVLVSFWRPLNSSSPSGTPAEWLPALTANLVEVHCRCSPALAERRFRDRRRHPGHNDVLRLPTLSNQLALLTQNGPLGVGSLVTVQTDDEYDIAAVIADVQRQLRQGG